MALGAYNLTDECTDPCVVRRVRSATPHFAYDEETLRHDIAVLELE